MIPKLRSSWQYVRKHWGVITAILLVTAFVFVIWAGYRFSWEWTGLAPETSETMPHAKTLWDWLNLLGVLAIPVIVGLGATWYTAQQGKVSEKETTDNQRETALQTYIDRMSNLLLSNKLRESVGENDTVRTLARLRTLTVLRRLDAERKGSVIQFLKESDLISKEKTIIILKGADLSEADLGGAELKNANFRGVNLSGADLKKADFRGADLSFANLKKADFSEANLVRTELRYVDLSEANLSGANLKKADFGGANLSGADLRKADLSEAESITTEELEKQAKSLQGATMPNKAIHS